MFFLELGKHGVHPSPNLETDVKTATVASDCAENVQFTPTPLPEAVSPALLDNARQLLAGSKDKTKGFSQAEFMAWASTVEHARSQGGTIPKFLGMVKHAMHLCFGLRPRQAKEESTVITSRIQVGSPHAILWED